MLKIVVLVHVLFISFQVFAKPLSCRGIFKSETAWESFYRETFFVRPFVREVIFEAKQKEIPLVGNMMLVAFVKANSQYLTINELSKLANGTTTRYHRSEVISTYFEAEYSILSVSQAIRIAKKLYDSNATKSNLLDLYFELHGESLTLRERSRFIRYAQSLPARDLPQFLETL